MITQTTAIIMCTSKMIQMLNIDYYYSTAHADEQR